MKILNYDRNLSSSGMGGGVCHGWRGGQWASMECLVYQHVGSEQRRMGPIDEGPSAGRVVLKLLRESGRKVERMEHHCSRQWWGPSGVLDRAAIQRWETRVCPLMNVMVT